MQTLTSRCGRIKTPVENLRALFTYNSLDGSIRWVNSSGTALSGEIAGWINGDGYRKITVCGRYFMAHRVAWAMQYGEWPDGDIDHINMVRSDNRIANLRLATRSQNAMNQKINRLNKSGFAGVRWDAGTRKWVASIGHEGRRIFLGNFDSKVDAVRIRLDAEIRLHGEYRPTNGGR